MYRVISEEYSTFMQNTKFKEILQNLKGDILSPFRVDMLKATKSGTFLVQLGTRELLDRVTEPLDISLSSIFLQLILGVADFDESFFSFFQCGDL